MIIERIRAEVAPGTIIPKPRPEGDYLVKKWGRRRNEVALVYSIPNHKTPSRPYEKGITKSEFERSFRVLKESGEFSRGWFDRNLPACAKEGSCNFTTIGGIFELLGEAQYLRNGVYRSK